MANNPYSLSFFAIGGIACLLLLCMRCTPTSFLRNFETNLICECQLRTEQTWPKFYKLREEFKITRLINFGVCGLILCFPKRLGNGRGKEGIVAVPSTLFTNRVITSDNSSVNKKSAWSSKVRSSVMEIRPRASYKILEFLKFSRLHCHG